MGFLFIPYFLTWVLLEFGTEWFTLACIIPIFHYINKYI